MFKKRKKVGKSRERRAKEGENEEDEEVEAARVRLEEVRDEHRFRKRSGGVSAESLAVTQKERRETKKVSQAIDARYTSETAGVAKSAEERAMREFVARRLGQREDPAPPPQPRLEPQKYRNPVSLNSAIGEVPLPPEKAIENANRTRKAVLEKLARGAPADVDGLLLRNAPPPS